MTLILGDNLDALPGISDAALVYMDPPFFKQRRFGKGEASFDDRWASLDAYLEHLQPRLARAWACLRDGGSLVLHLDSTVSHYAKVLGDGLFGRETFASEIVWRYRRWPSKQRNFQRVHDTLLRWVTPGEPAWNQLYEPLSPKTIATWGTQKQKAIWVPGKGAEKTNSRRKCSSATAEQSPGVPLGDVWDLSIVAPMAKERTGYPTQKPMALLERLIEATTNPGDLVVDPYVGSGTTLEAALKLGRRGLGIDINPHAIELCRERLGAAA